MSIDLDGVEPSGSANLTDEAFAKPSSSAALYWFLGTAFPAYTPYLIKATGIDGDLLSFRGVDLTDPDTDFGKDGSNDYVVNLTNLRHVYRDEPSTLTNLTASGSTKYAVLFLTKLYVDTYDTNDHLAAAKGGGKWPKGAGL